MTDQDLPDTPNVWAETNVWEETKSPLAKMYDAWIGEGWDDPPARRFKIFDHAGRGFFCHLCGKNAWEEEDQTFVCEHDSSGHNLIRQISDVSKSLVDKGRTKEISIE